MNRPRPPDPAGAVHLQLIGTPHLRCGGEAFRFTAERRYQLLALLGMSRGAWITRDRIAGLLWPSRSNEDARRNLRTVISRLREVPGLQGLELADQGLRWIVDSDVSALEAAAGVSAVEDIAHSPAAWLQMSDPLLQGMDDPSNGAWSDWLASQRQRVAQRWRQIALARLDVEQEPAARVALAGRLLQADPLDEDALATLLAAEQARGGHARAQRAYREYAARLAQELNVEPSAALRSLYEACRTSANASGAPAGVSSSTGMGGGFVGRREELASLRGMLVDPQGRFVTLVGPGGIGKSRLALEAANRWRDAFADGCVVVKLEDLESREQAVSRLAQVLELEVAQVRDPMEPVLRWLRPRCMLLVFDNAEHLAEAHDLFDRLREGCPTLSLCVTSRRSTGRPGERVIALGGLPWPDEESRDAESAAAYDAVQLFAQRASATLRGFDRVRHQDAVASIVQAVGGMPLAIELAAGWVRMLPPEEIARDLRGSIDLLERDPASAGAPARKEHVSLRAVLEQSWTMLAPRERDGLSALTVFRAGFTRAAAAAVAKASMPVLSSLVDKGLLAVDDQGRFALHPVISAFAAEALAPDEGRRGALALSHARWYAAELDALAGHALGDVRVLARGVAAELSNATAAWHTAVRGARVELVDQLVRALWRYFEYFGQQHEGVALLTPALALDGRDGAAAPGPVAADDPAWPTAGGPDHRRTRLRRIIRLRRHRSPRGLPHPRGYRAVAPGAACRSAAALRVGTRTRAPGGRLALHRPGPRQHGAVAVLDG